MDITPASIPPDFKSPGKPCPGAYGTADSELEDTVGRPLRVHIDPPKSARVALSVALKFWDLQATLLIDLLPRRTSVDS